MKKTVLSMLSLLLCAGLMTGCGGSAPAASDITEAPSETQTNSVRAEETEAPAETETPAGEAGVDAGMESEPEIIAPEDGGRFVGQWTDSLSQRAWMTIIPTDHFGVYSVLLHWGDTAATFYEWTMTAAYDEADDSIRYTDGSCSFVTLNEDEEERREPVWDASEGRFFFEGDALRWEDTREETDSDVSFERVTTYAPTAAELLGQYFTPIAEIPNATAGAMLRQAQVACDTLRFADAYAVWSCDPAELRANLKEAWAGLSAEEQAAFGDNVFEVHGLVVNAAVDWANYAYLFEDAGIAEQMLALEADRTAMESFYRLFDAAVAVCLTEG